MSALALVTPTAENDALRWQQWRQHYDESSHSSMRRMRLLFTGALIAAVAFVARALLF